MGQKFAGINRMLCGGGTLEAFSDYGVDVLISKSGKRQVSESANLFSTALVRLDYLCITGKNREKPSSEKKWPPHPETVLDRWMAYREAFTATKKGAVIEIVLQGKFDYAVPLAVLRRMVRLRDKFPFKSRGVAWQTKRFKYLGGADDRGYGWTCTSHDPKVKDLDGHYVHIRRVARKRTFSEALEEIERKAQAVYAGFERHDAKVRQIMGWKNP